MSAADVMPHPAPPGSPAPASAPAEEPAAAPSSAGRRKALVKRLVKFAVAGAILWYLFTHVPFGEVVAEVRAAHLGWLAAAFAAALVMQLGVADRLRRLLTAQGVRLTTFEVFEINLATLFYGLFLPGGNFTGIAIRFYRLSSANQDMLRTGVALFFDRLLATFCLLLLGIGFWFLAPQPGGGFFALGAMAVAALGFAGLTAALFAPAETPVIGTLQRLMKKFGGRKINKLRGAMQDVWTLPKPTLAVAFGLAFFTHFAGMVAYWFVLHAMGLPVGFVTIAWVRSAMILATMIPLTPSGVGLREGATLMLLTAYGVGHDEALAYSLLIFGVTVLGVGLVGGVFEAWRMLLAPAKPRETGVSTS